MYVTSTSDTHQSLFYFLNTKLREMPLLLFNSKTIGQLWYSEAMYYKKKTTTHNDIYRMISLIVQPYSNNLRHDFIQYLMKETSTMC